jgi:hypothetical protein
MFELLLNFLGHWVLPYLGEAAKNRAATNDPEHIKSPKRIDRYYAL